MLREMTFKDQSEGFTKEFTAGIRIFSSPRVRSVCAESVSTSTSSSSTSSSGSGTSTSSSSSILTGGRVLKVQQQLLAVLHNVLAGVAQDLELGRLLVLLVRATVPI